MMNNNTEWKFRLLASFPAARVRFDYYYRTQERLPVLNEYALRLIKISEQVPISAVQSLFALNKEESQTLVQNLIAENVVYCTNNELALTEGGKLLFVDEEGKESDIPHQSLMKTDRLRQTFIAYKDNIYPVPRELKAQSSNEGILQLEGNKKNWSNSKFEEYFCTNFHSLAPNSDRYFESTKDCFIERDDKYSLLLNYYINEFGDFRIGVDDANALQASVEENISEALASHFEWTSYLFEPYENKNLGFDLWTELFCKPLTPISSSTHLRKILEEIQSNIDINMGDRRVVIGEDLTSFLDRNEFLISDTGFFLDEQAINKASIYYKPPILNVLQPSTLDALFSETPENWDNSYKTVIKDTRKRLSLIKDALTEECSERPKNSIFTLKVATQSDWEYDIELTKELLDEKGLIALANPVTEFIYIRNCGVILTYHYAIGAFKTFGDVEETVHLPITILSTSPSVIQRFDELIKASELIKRQKAREKQESKTTKAKDDTNVINNIPTKQKPQKTAKDITSSQINNAMPSVGKTSSNTLQSAETHLMTQLNKLQESLQQILKDSKYPQEERDESEISQIFHEPEVNQTNEDPVTHQVSKDPEIKKTQPSYRTKTAQVMDFIEALALIRYYIKKHSGKDFYAPTKDVKEEMDNFPDFSVANYGSKSLIDFLRRYPSLYEVKVRPDMNGNIGVYVKNVVRREVQDDEYDSDDNNPDYYVR